MDWKREVIEKLRVYSFQKNALVSIPEEIERIEESMCGIRAVATDAVLGSGKRNTCEDRLLSKITQQRMLERRLAETRSWLTTMDRALNMLSREDRLILERFYIHPAKGNVDRLCEELAIEKPGLYKRKEKALRRLILAMYGTVES